MKNGMTAGAALLLTTSIASAGGLDRSGNAYSVLFEEGNYVQLSFSSTMPDVTGDYLPGNPPDGLGGGSTGNMANDYFNAGLALKYGITEEIDLALFINQPVGADSEYTAGFYTGLTAKWESTQIAAVGKYKVDEQISVYGGLRAVRSQPTIGIPLPLVFGAGGPPQSYAAETESDTRFGYILGAAYERPEIALRVALTYESAVKHEFDTTEQFNGSPAMETVTEIELPQSLTLDFQSGIAADTLLFGSVRWAEWSVWEVRPPEYDAQVGDRVTGIDDDVFTYRIGIGRSINDQVAIFGRVTYEEATGGVANRLSPTDGSTSFGFGGSYTMDAYEISGGIEYALLGDGTDSTGTAFEDNTAIGFGVNIGFSF